MYKSNGNSKVYTQVMRTDNQVLRTPGCSGIHSMPGVAFARICRASVKPDTWLSGTEFRGLHSDPR